jgi:hypothetical protein
LLKETLNLKEKELTSIQIDSAEVVDSSSETPVALEVKENLVQGENIKFLIRVDRLTDGRVIYRSWSKPKTIIDNPDLELENGTIERQGTGGGYHYIFKNGNWNYILEKKMMGESYESIGLFLRLLKNDSEILYSRLSDITIDYSEKDSYSKSDLFGRWWTPHYAVRKLELFENNRFKFNDGGNNISTGNFWYADRIVTLSFDSNKNDIVLKIGGGNGDYSYTLIGDGENFVNER